MDIAGGEGHIEITDQCNRLVRLDTAPQRIVSLVPSQTELLYDIGLDDRVVGITKFCVHPQEWYETKTRVGGTKKLHFDVIESLRPDLIIANKEENNRADIQRLEKEYSVMVTDVRDFFDPLQMMIQIGIITNKEREARSVAEHIYDQLLAVRGKQFERVRALYLIWKEPFMAAGQDTFIHQMMELARFENVLTAPESRYPELSDEAIKKLNPEVILLSSEPFPFKGKHTEEVKKRFPESRVIEVDGELFSWYGSRLQYSADYIRQLRSTI